MKTHGARRHGARGVAASGTFVALARVSVCTDGGAGFVARKGPNMHVSRISGAAYQLVSERLSRSAPITSMPRDPSGNCQSLPWSSSVTWSMASLRSAGVGESRSCCRAANHGAEEEAIVERTSREAEDARDVARAARYYPPRRRVRGARSVNAPAAVLRLTTTHSESARDKVKLLYQ